MKKQFRTDHSQSPIPPVSWDKISHFKWERDLEIRKTQDVNRGLLAKIGWTILTEPNNLLIKIVCKISH